MTKLYPFITIALLVLMGNMITDAQDKRTGYQLTFEIDGMPDTTFVLAYYFDEGTYTRDTARSDGKGKVIFKGDKPLPKGVYILVLESSKSKLFDFVVYNNQFFTLKTNTWDPYRNMVANDPDNKLFFENMIYNAGQNVKAQPYTTIANDSLKTEEERAAARKKLGEINDEVLSYQLGLIKIHPNTLVAKILNGRRRVEVPEAPADLSGEEAQAFRYRYFKDHFWDYFEMEEDALVRLPFPLYREKIDEYFDKVVVQHPDSLIAEISRIVARVKPNSETYKYVVWSLTTKFYAPEIMGLDAVFVHLYDTYFKSGEMDFWANDQLKDNLKDRADKLRLSFIGMKAPNLIMQDAKLQPRSLYDIRNKYTVIYFYDPDCGHCKKETPVLVNFYNQAKFDIQVYSVSADTSLLKMKNYIKDMGMQKWVNVNGPRSYVGHYQDLYDAFQTPTLYVINEEKKIIAKKLPSDMLEDFLTRYEAVENKREQQ